MADIFDTVSVQSPAKGVDIFDQVSTHEPADANIGVDKFWAEHPYFKAAGDTLQQAFVNPVVQAGNAIIPAMNGITKGLGIPEDQPGRQISGPDMSNAPMSARVLGDVASGVTKGAAATAIGAGNPFLGFGALSGLEAIGKNQNPVWPAFMGAASAIPQVIAGKAGSTLATAGAKRFGDMFGQFAPQIEKYAPNVGTAVGMGGESAGQAALTGGNPVEAGVTGATFGAMSPMGQFGAPKQMTQEQYDSWINNKANDYRQILNPGKGMVNKFEVKSGKDLDDVFKLAAEEGIILHKSQDGKLDTSGAVKQLAPKTAELNGQINDILSQDQTPSFDLNDLADQAKSQLDGRIKNALELKQAKNQVDNEIKAEIEKNGQYVNGSTLNNIKQGMWGKAYDLMAPTNNIVARQIGVSAKDAIEKLYPNNDIRGINQQLGKYYDLKNVLESSHGNVVQAGKIGKYVAQGIGALSGHATAIPGAEIAGSWAGGKLSQFLNDPHMKTSNISKQGKNIEITNPKPKAIPSVVKQKAKEGLNDEWYRGMFGNLN